MLQKSGTWGRNEASSKSAVLSVFVYGDCNIKIRASDIYAFIDCTGINTHQFTVNIADFMAKQNVANMLYDAEWYLEMLEISKQWGTQEWFSICIHRSSCIFCMETSKFNFFPQMCSISVIHLIWHSVGEKVVLRRYKKVFCYGYRLWMLLYLQWWVCVSTQYTYVHCP